MQPHQDHLPLNRKSADIQFMLIDDEKIEKKTGDRTHEK